MPERNNDFGKFGASGVKGSELVGRKLDDLAGGIVTPVTAKRGLMARLNYLTRSDHARQAAREAGLTVTDRTLKAWLEGKRGPSKKNLKKIDDAYQA
ncbi:helix-turn-helix domain-containing protein, partial [Streptomyces sp. NPDC058220]|uniref:helix-turn-helix domain-containing protein n=1 Tax=Streptomyces sp. NPDC058220 TaxID=3346387 RepID=UPI0036EEF4C0